MNDRESGMVDEYVDVLTYCQISTITPRYDLSPQSVENRSIREINKRISELGSIFSNTNLFSSFPKGVFTSTIRRRLLFEERSDRYKVCGLLRGLS
ncbi:hypothetical protein J6590_040742 [Homalodisca vitripennis]|nr:hypothetical protein J6590_040742 [Homalodisca vitripennis]